MKKVLLVSPFPYTHSNRGMDVFTEAFETSGWDTHHLQFPTVFYSVRKDSCFDTSVIEYKARTVWLPYVDTFMKNLPTSIFKRIVRNHRKSVQFIDWNSYDVVVLESGKPLFLLDLIPKETCLIYRQSDSVREILGKNPDYIALEDDALERGKHILVVKERYKNTIPRDFREKVKVIRNGFSIPKDAPPESPFAEGTINAIYVGLADLDWECVEFSCRKNPNVLFHYFGDGLKRIPKRKIRSLPNLIDYGFVSMAEYHPHLAHADLYVYPFKRNDFMKVVGLTSKFYMAMHYNLPIVCYRMEPKEEFKNLPVDFCDSPEEFAAAVGRIAAEKPKRHYPLPWDELKHEARTAEYKRLISDI